ncbi:hypothetical protein SBADM41S_04203 [Streptomyces badius]
MLLRRRGEQEQGAGPVGELVEAFGVGGQHGFTAGQGPGQRGASGELIRGEAAGEPGQQTRVSARLAEEFGAHDRVEPFRAGGQPAQERRGRRFVQGREVQSGQSGEGGAVGGREEEGDPAARTGPAGREGEGGPRRRIPDVRVVDADQQRPAVGEVPQSAGQGLGHGVGGEGGGCDAGGGSVERGAGGQDTGRDSRARGGHPRTGPGHVRPEQGPQSAVGHGTVGGSGHGPQHGAPVPVRVGCRAEQSRTAETGRRRQHQRAAVASP